jgi:hypothetical protein
MKEEKKEMVGDALQEHTYNRRRSYRLKLKCRG